MTIRTVQGVVDRREFSAWFHVFQGANSSWRADSRMLAGNFFFGLQAYNAAIFNGADIPAGAEILSATATYTTQQTGNGAAIVIQLNTPFRGDTYPTRPFTKPFGHREWRQQQWDAPELDLRNAAFGIIADSPVTPAIINRNWALWFEDSTAQALSHPPDAKAMRQRQAAKMTPLAVGGGQVLTQSFTTLRRQGNLAAGTNVFMDIHAEKFIDGVSVPDDDQLLATSDAFAASSINVQNPYLFTFSGDNQITLTPGVVVHAVMRIDPEPPVSTFNYITQYGRNAFFQPQQTLHFGAGVGLDWQNFPGTADLGQGVVAANSMGADILWSPANFPAVGSSHTTPDISALIQDQVDHPNYSNAGKVLILTQFTVGQTPQNRIWASFNSARPAPVIDITYDDANIPGRGVGAGGGGHGARVVTPQPQSAIVMPGGADQDAIDAALAVTAIETYYD